MRIVVPERGHVDISRDTWATLSAAPEVWRLIERKVMSTSIPNAATVRIEGSRFVGRAQFGEVRLDFVEKVPGSLAAMLRFATRNAFQISQTPAPATALGELAALLCNQFVEALSAYLTVGRDFRYTTERHVASLIGGRLDVRATTALRARGFRHKAAFYRTVLVHNTLKNRVLLAAVREIERISRVIDLDAATLTRARGLAMLFDDCRDAEVLFGSHEHFARYAEEIMNDPAEQRHADLLALANVVLSHASFEHNDVTDGAVPRTWFLDLEKLFETAVRQLLRGICAMGVSITKPTTDAPHIFSGLQDLYTANPDLVVAVGGTPAAIGDVKYKPWTGTPEHGDIYQLQVHTSTIGGPNAFLIYPHDVYQAMPLGSSRMVNKTWAFAVDVRTLDVGLRAAMVSLGVPVA